MDDGVDLVRAEDVAQRAAVADVDLHEGQLAPGDLFDPAEHRRLAV